jgi:hypothetical protein
VWRSETNLYPIAASGRYVTGKSAPYSASAIHTVRLEWLMEKTFMIQLSI